MEVREMKGSEIIRGRGGGAQEVPCHIPCLSKVIQRVRPGYLELHLVGSWKFPRNTAQRLWGTCATAYPSSQKKCFSSWFSPVCPCPVFLLAIATLKSLVNLPVGTGEVLLGPMKPSLLQDEQTQLPQVLFTEQVLQPLSPWWIPVNSLVLPDVFTGGPETGQSINLSFHGINGSHQQTLLFAKCPSP